MWAIDQPILSPAAIAAVVGAILFVVVLLRLRRRISSGKLPLPPGPGGFPILGALPLIGPRPHSGLAALAKVYGPIMYLKMGTCHVVVASTAAAAATFLKTFDAQFAHRPSTAISDHVTYGGNTMVFSNYGPLLKLFRKLLHSHLLGPKAFSDWSHVRRSELRHMIKSIRTSSSSGTAVELPEVLMFSAANIIGQIMFSRRVFDAKTEELTEFKEMISEMLTGVGLFNIGDFVPSIAWMDLQGVQKKAVAAHAKYDRLITKLLSDHAATVSDRSGRPDFIDIIQSDRPVADDGRPLTDVNIKGLILDMFNAGTDTSTIVVEWALAEMLLNPAIMKRAQAELDKVVGVDRLLEESDIPNLPYLQVICKEALRKHPPTPLSIPHYTFDPCEVNAAFRLPAKTRLLVNIWAIGRDPAVWEDPEVFDPDRFLEGGRGAAMEINGSDFELIPFGSGRRICAGKQAGLVFVQYFLGALVHGFDWAMPPGELYIDMEETPGIVLPKKVPLKAVATPRLSKKAYEDD